MRKRFVGLAMASVLLATACGSTATPAPATRHPDRGGGLAAAGGERAGRRVTLTLRYCWGGEGEVKAMEKVIQAWNSAHPRSRSGASAATSRPRRSPRPSPVARRRTW